MPPRKLTIRNNHVEDLFAKSTYKAPVKPFTESEFIQNYRFERDKVLNQLFPDSAIEYGLIGIKSANAAKIVAETRTKHAEITLQAKFCKWVSKEYPELKYLRHEREKARSKFMGNQMKVMNSAGAMPDWELTKVTDKYAGLYIEFKRPRVKWLLKDDKTVKPAYAHQHYCHNNLWLERKVCYFCNDLEVAKAILIRYLSGKDMPQRIYNYPKGYEHLKI